MSRRLREEGVGASVKHTAVISHDEESALWESGVIGVHNPKALLNAVFFLNRKVLCLRGGREHKSLKVSQFAFGSDEGGEYVLYTDIKERTGHRSVDSLRLYEHTSVMQQKSVSAVICSPLEQQFENKPPSSVATAPTVAGGVQSMFQGCQNCTFNICFNQK